jgi:hypothetical protein
MTYVFEERYFHPMMLKVLKTYRREERNEKAVS